MAIVTTYNLVKDVAQQVAVVGDSILVVPVTNLGRLWIFEQDNQPADGDFSNGIALDYSKETLVARSTVWIMTNYDTMTVKVRN